MQTYYMRHNYIKQTDEDKKRQNKTKQMLTFLKAHVYILVCDWSDLSIWHLFI